jgi:NAD(P)-dependent dehydrogenase (short-subunit alcohol dehydrogenase family)
MRKGWSEPIGCVKPLPYCASGIERDHHTETYKERFRKEIERIPLGRPGKIEEIAELVSSLAFKDSYITGAVIQVDGGMGM